jgi:hypothetical protein
MALSRLEHFCTLQECLEGQFYSFATTGSGLPAAATGGELVCNHAMHHYS